MPKKQLFPTITGKHWTDALKITRALRNPISEQLGAIANRTAGASRTRGYPLVPGSVGMDGIPQGAS